MREHAIFVPHGDEHLAAIVTIPDGEPRGLALLLCGLGAPRSHRYQMWTRTARRIGEQGIAVIRMDYAGIGDSSGEAREFRVESEASCRAQAVSVLRLGMDVVGVRRVVLAGNCVGGTIAMAVASEVPEVVGVAGILPPLVAPSAVKSRLSKAKRSKVAQVVRSNPLLRKVVLERLRGMEGRTSSTIREWFAGTLSHARLLFLFGEDDHRLTGRMKTQIDSMLATLPPGDQARYEIRVLPQGPLAGFESIDIQDATIDAISEFVGRCFSEPLDDAAAPAVAAS